MNIKKRILETQYVQSAIEEQADLSAFKKKPTPKIIAGILLIITSFIICWPAISVLGAISLYYKAPIIVIAGGPLLYGLSHLVFLLGMYFSGAEYSKIFFRWVTRKIMEKK